MLVSLIGKEYPSLCMHDLHHKLNISVHTVQLEINTLMMWIDKRKVDSFGFNRLLFYAQFHWRKMKKRFKFKPFIRI